MYTLPTEIKINDDTLHIRERGDFRVILDCFSALQDAELDEDYRILTAALIFYTDFNADINTIMQYPALDIAINEMFRFFACNEPQDTTKRRSHVLIDWEADSQMISSAINKVAGKEIRAEAYVHWWTFMGYYNAIGPSVLSTVVGIRKKVADGKKLEKHEIEFKKNNPQYFIRDFRTPEQKLADEQFRKMWNK